MREIKFRGKDIDQNKWRYGSLVLWVERSDNGLSEHQFKEIETILHKIVDSECQQWIICTKSISQFTGMKDCRNIDIYEGDIVEYSDVRGSGIKYIDWCDNKMCYVVIDSIEGVELNLGGYYSHEITIIDNMYDRLNNNEVK